jgi:hypothetical protein
MHYVGLDDWCPMKNIGLNFVGYFLSFFWNLIIVKSFGFT